MQKSGKKLRLLRTFLIVLGAIAAFVVIVIILNANLLLGYCGARAIAQFDQIIQDGFLKPRGITAYTHYRFVENYYEIYPYTGGLVIRLTVWGQGTAPQEVGWLYDFYNYWRKEADYLTEYGVNINIVENRETIYHIYYDNESCFSDESVFYAAFEEGY